ncbi:hypothetical protein [Streptomyces sp. TRM49041]|uniref:hypothetical protein n=1 Tax=Streptomyces sp. TRM49041 TaxID=2603216 RepID=UPI0011EF1870|nr:hypothetical protein [Streptomyces sp. TRM49041]
MNADQVNAAFTHVQQRFNRTPCRECRGRNTVALIIMGAVIVSCEDCGGATRKGQLTTAPGID